MNRDQVRELLRCCRSEAEAAGDPQMAEALAQVGHDPDLAAWWERQRAFHAGARQAFRGVLPPAGLRERILAERPAAAIVPWPWPVKWAIAAGLVMLLALGGQWLRSRDGRSLDSFRNRMAKVAQRDYRMDLLSRDAEEIRRYLRARDGWADYRLSPGMERLPGMGCGVLRWMDQPVSMVCFDRGGQQPLFLFVADQKALAAGAPGPEPEFREIGRLTTATWTRDGLVYVLAAKGGREVLAPYL